MYIPKITFCVLQEGIMTSCIFPIFAYIYGRVGGREQRWGKERGVERRRVANAQGSGTALQSLCQAIFWNILKIHLFFGGIPFLPHYNLKAAFSDKLLLYVKPFLVFPLRFFCIIAVFESERVCVCACVW